jgi:hypothetical protein
VIRFYPTRVHLITQVNENATVASNITPSLPIISMGVVIRTQQDDLLAINANQQPACAGYPTS